MTITAAFCPFSGQMLFDANAQPIPGGSISFFDAGTTNPRAAYADAGLTTSRGSSVSSDAFGRFPAMFIGAGAYKAVLADASDAQLAVYDGLAGGTDSGGGNTTPTGTVIPTGFLMAAHTDDAVDGWLPCNGLTIGSGDSVATARADDDVQALFIKLWNKDASLTVLGGRGLTAGSDWSANKTIALPDYRGRAIVGLDGMGVAPAGILTTASVPTPNVLGTKAGIETWTLTGDQLPTITPTVTVNAAGGHTHTGVANTAGSHSHTGVTGTNGGHTHDYVTVDQTTGCNSAPGANPFATVKTAQTGASGNHQHALAIDAAGDHTHTLNVAPVADHTHTATVAPLGSGQSHPNVQPSMLVYINIKI